MKRKQTLKEKVDAAMATLDAGIENLVTSEDWMESLKFQARFHTYSWNNQFLIAIQRPGATRVAGFHAWKRMGRHVNKGERGIAIFAPMVLKRTVEAEDGTEQTRTFIRYKVVYVWDVSQTSGKALPEVDRVRPVQIEGEGPEGLLEALKRFSEEELGVPVRVATISRPTCLGYLDLATKSITLKAGLGGAQACKVLAHEIGHAMLHLDQVDVHARQVMEVEAESVAFLLGHILGVDATGSYSFPYIAEWAGGSEGPAAVKRAGARVQKAVCRVLDWMEGGQAAAAEEAA